ncbi:MAG: sigma-70 family RNA polymerase sigma factor [Bacteroidales bacterium]|jgi:RNA polymerase sigma factor (sigma-70 family)
MKVIKDDPVASDMSNESDEDLLVIVSMKDDPHSSNLAFNEFYRRYKRFIFGMAYKVTEHLPNSVELRDAIFQNTLINIYKYCDSFSVFGEKDPETIRRMIHGWIVKIEKNELKSLLSDRQYVADNSDESKEKDTTDNNIDEDNEPISYNESIVRESLKLLNERDQHIFMTYWLFYEQGKGSQAKNLPAPVLDGLASQYETTPENIRQIISRSKKKIFDFLKANYNLKRK